MTIPIIPTMPMNRLFTPAFSRWVFGVLLGILACGAAVPVAAAMLDVLASGQTITAVEGVSPAEVTIGGIDPRIVAIQDNQDGNVGPVHLEARLIGIGSASFGSLSGSISARAENQAPPNNPYSARANGRITLGFTETALVSSPTLPIGAPITLNFDVRLAAGAFLTPGAFGQLDNGASAGFDARVTDLATNQFVASFSGVDSTFTGPASQTMSLANQVGRTLRLFGQLEVGASVRIDDNFTGQNIIRTAAVNAANTAHLYYQPSGDILLLSESGHSYLAPGPPAPITVGTLIGTSVAIPGGSGAFTSFKSPTFAAITPGPSAGGDAVAFLGAGSGGQQGIYRVIPQEPIVPGNPVKLADLNTAIPDGTGNFTGFFPQLSTHGGEAAVLATGSGGQQGIYRFAPQEPIRVADSNTAVPGGTGNFTDFPLVAPAISDGNFAFRASGVSGQQGVYLGPVDAIVPGNPVKVADLNTAIPDGTGNFTGFIGGPAISGANAAFIGTGAAGQQGVYRVIPPDPVIPGNPVKVANTTTTMPGTPTRSIPSKASRWIAALPAPIWLSSAEAQVARAYLRISLAHSHKWRPR